MLTKEKVEIIDLIDHYELLLMFRDYVNQCIENYNHSNKTRPLSFDEWYNVEYLPNIESLTQVVTFKIHWHQCQSYQSADHNCRISADTVSEGGGVFDSNALKRFAKKLAHKNHFQETFVMYCDMCFYRWSADI
jgi:hypothetical protein